MSTKHSELLNLARAIAIALVLLRHGYISQLELSIQSNPWPTLAANLALNGWLGVDLFFVLSGFLLSRQLLECGRSSGTVEFVVRFWRRRAYRILPCYLMVLIPLWLIREYSGDVSAGTGHLQLLIHLLFLQDYLGSELLITTWSLATEEKFYLLLPLLVIVSFCTSSMRFAGVLMAASVLILISKLITCWTVAPTNYPDFFWQVRAPFHNALDGLLMGMATGYIFQANPRWLNRLSQQTKMLLLLALFLVATVLLVSFNWLDTSFMLSCVAIWTASIISSGLVLVGVSSERNSNQPFKKWSFVSWLAAVSYPLYLAHYLMLFPAESIALAADQSPYARQIIFWFAYLVGSFALAWLLHIAIEKPFLRLRESRKFSHTIVSPAPL